MGVTFEVETANLLPLIAALDATPTQVTGIVRSVMRRGMVLAERHAKEIAKTALRVRTGMLVKSIRGKVEEDADAIYGVLGLAKAGAGAKVLLYAAVQELGTDGPIVAKKAYRKVPGGPYLNIPLEAALTPAGVARFTAREAADVYPGGTFIAKSKAGNWILFGRLTDSYGRGGRVTGSGSKRARVKAGHSANIVPLFVLKKEVPKIEPKYFLLTGIERVLPYVSEAIASNIASRLALQDSKEVT